MDRPRSRQRANPVGADQPEHKPPRTSQALEQTKAPSKLASVNFLCFQNEHRSRITRNDFTQRFGSRLGPQIYTVQSKRFETVSGRAHSGGANETHSDDFSVLIPNCPVACFGLLFCRSA